MTTANDDKEVKVSIWCVTYNHADYIREALDGFLMQKTKFSFNIMIFDDASTDGTSDIVREYAEQYPHIIHAVIAKENTWHDQKRRKKLFGELMRKYLTGKYIARCEGDDFWIDQNKLQIQVDYLETHQNCSLYLHDALWLNCSDGTMKVRNIYELDDNQCVTPEDIIMQYKGNPPTASFLYRRELLDCPQFFYDAPVGDYTVLLYALSCGEIHYSNRIMSVYRCFAKNSYTSLLKKDVDLQVCFNLGMLHFCYKYDEFTGYRYHKWCTNKIQEYAARFVMLANPELLIQECINHCRDSGYFVPVESFKYINELENLRKKRMDRTYLADEIREYIDQHDAVYIMGAGKYAEIISSQFTNNKKEYKGFVVTQRRENEEYYLGKPVLNLSEMPQGTENIGVVIGIDPIRWDTIQKSLSDAGIMDYYCPFLMKENG